MKLFITDESNLARDNLLAFFIYGGLIVDGAESRQMVENLERIKTENSIPLDRPIKWENINWRGNGELDPALHAAMKDQMLNIVGNSGTKIVVYLAPQDFYHVWTLIRRLSEGLMRSRIDPDRKKRAIEYAVNACLHKYDSFLHEANDYGIVIADDFGDSSLKEHMRAHCFGLYPHGGKYSNLERISYPVLTIDEAYSELHQLNDVVLGAIQHSLKEMAHNFLPLIRQNFWCSDSANPYSILGRGFDVYPKRAGERLVVEISSLKNKFIRLVSV